jgi:1,4-alpha-glucan branching enzyme
MPEAIGDLAIVLHSHMPYVEGFGTYPFGEEWLFDAVARSHVPVLDVAEGLTMTVTPVLADQLEAPGVGERTEAFVRAHRFLAARADAEELGEELRSAARAEADRYERVLETLSSASPLDLFRRAHDEGRIELMASAATHAVLPLVASRAGRRLQIDAGIRSHHRRFGRPTGFWLPECAYAPGLEALLAERDVRYFCVDQSAHERGLAALAPVATPAGPVAFTIDWEAIAWLWAPGGYPAHPAHTNSFHATDRGIRLWAVDGSPYDRDRAESAAREQAADFAEAVAARLREFAAERGRPGLVVFAIDTELLGHWWREGTIWLEEVLRQAPGRGVCLVTLTEALGRHTPEERELRAGTWGEGKDLGTWDSPEVADLVRGARRLELRALRALRGGDVSPPRGERAVRELLAVQASDWAFLDKRGEAGDYPYGRVTAHAEALLEAIDSPAGANPRLRNLAPDLSLAPLLEP